MEQIYLSKSTYRFLCINGTSIVALGVKNAPAVQETCSVPRLGRSPGEGNGYQLQYSGLENSMGYIAHGVANSQT